MITFNPLWETLKKKNISQYKLIHHYGVSSSQINRLKNNCYVSTHTIGMLCTLLDCQISDIMEFHMDNSELAFPTPDMYEHRLQEADHPSKNTPTD